MPDKPLVSVVMPCYNASRYVQAAIDSILRQTYDNLELIVVDDNSADNSVDLISNFKHNRLRLLRNPINLGVTRTLNRAIRVAEGELIARMDADDLCEPTRIECQVEVMRRDPGLAVVGTGVKIIDQDGGFLCYHYEPADDCQIRQELACRLPLWPGSQMWRRDKLFHAGLFDERIPSAEDLELILRLCRWGKARNIKKPLYIYRKNFSGETNIGVFSQGNRIVLARKIYFLKSQGNIEELARYYKICADHFERNKFAKTVVPSQNQGFYYRNIVLLNLINNNKKQAKTYLDKAREIEPWKAANFALAMLIIMPQSVTNKLYSLYKMAKNVMYKTYCGDIMQYLNHLPRVSDSN